VSLLSFLSASAANAQWIHSSETTGSVNCFAVSGSNLFNGTYDVGVFLSTDNGTSWSAVNTGLTDKSVSALAVSDTNLFVGTCSGGIFRSTNNGTLWTQSGLDYGDDIISALAVVPNGTDGTNIFAGTNWNIFLSTDNGTNWTDLNNLFDVSAFAMVPDEAGVTKIFAGSVTGVFLSTNDGASWTAVNTGLPIFSHVCALAVRSNGAGSTSIFAGTYSNGVFRSTNDGTNWTERNAGLWNKLITALVVSPTQHLFAGTQGGGVFVSTNNGTNWTAFNTGLTNTNVHALVVSGTNLFAGTDDGVWMRPLNEVVPIELALFNAATESNAVVLTWTTATEVNNYGFEIERRVIKELPGQWNQIGFVKGSGTSNSSRNYSYVDRTLPSGRYAYRLKQINNDGAFKYHGSIEVEVRTPESFSLSQNYPNPFNPVTTIRYALPARTCVKLQIFNMLGQTVAELVGTEQNAGYQSVVWNANVASGIYFYRLTAGSYTMTKKLVLLR
jgi:hypothetical protein